MAVINSGLAEIDMILSIVSKAYDNVTTVVDGKPPNPSIQITRPLDETEYRKRISALLTSYNADCVKQKRQIEPFQRCACIAANALYLRQPIEYLKAAGVTVNIDDDPYDSMPEIMTCSWAIFLSYEAYYREMDKTRSLPDVEISEFDFLHTFLVTKISEYQKKNKQNNTPQSISNPPLSLDDITALFAWMSRAHRSLVG